MEKLYLNIQEQVEKNKNDIEYIIEQRGVLNEFGITVVGQEASIDDLPTVAEYKEDHDDWKYGDAYAIGEEEPYELYILTRANTTHPNDYWFDLGQFPLPGPQGETGETGEQGPAGAAGEIVGVSVSVDSDSTGTPSASVTMGGTSTARTFAFSFSNLKGNTGPQGDPGAFFVIAGQVANASLLPSASDVPTTQAYMVGSSTPYDVYCIMTVSGVKSWLNLGPVAVVESDTKVGSNTYAATGTLNSLVLDEIVNNTSMDAVKIGNIIFAKADLGKYYAVINNSGTFVVYCMIINTSTGDWSITTQNMVDEASAQTITGLKTIKSELELLSATENHRFKIKGETNGQLYFLVDNTQTVYFGNSGFRHCSNLNPWYNNQSDIGSSTLQYKDGYFAGQVYAQNTFNVINATDIVNNTLTQAQYDLITNGKMTLINNYQSGYIIVFPLIERTNDWLATCFRVDLYGSGNIQAFSLYKSTKVISIYQSGLNNFGTVYSINGKTLNYYQNNVYPYATNSTTTLQYETINNIELSANKTFTLATAPANTYPEYKGNIENTSNANTITLTFTGVDVIKCNNPSIVIYANTLDLPPETTIEFSIQNGKMVAVDWDYE